jgi:hypothetical protein
LEHSLEDLSYAAVNNIKSWNVDECTGDDGITDAYGDIRFLDKSDDLSKVTRKKFDF